MKKISRAILVWSVGCLVLLGGSLSLVAQEEPDLPDPIVPIFEVPTTEDSVPQFVIPPLESVSSSDEMEFPISDDLSGAYMPTVLAPAQTISSFYWPFETSATGQLYNYTDSAWTRSTLGIAACPPQSQRSSYPVPYCYAGNQGLDIRLPQTGVPVLASRSGYITEVRNACTFSGTSPTEPVNCPSGGSLPWTYGNYVRMKHDDGSFTFYAHLQKDSMLPPNANTRIEVGTQIGLVGNTGNITEPRLHLQFWNSSSTWIDPYGAGLWVRENNQIVAAADAFKLNPNERIAIVQSNNNFFIKQGTLTSDWHLESASSGQFQLAGNRLGVMDTGNDLYVKDVSVSAGWQLIREDIVDFVLDGSRIGVLLPNNEFHTKEGDLNAAWSLQSNTAIAIQISGNRMGLIDLGNDLYVKEDGGVWTLIREDVSAFQLNGNRIGVLLPNNEFYVKEGAIDAPWTLQSNTAKSFQIHGNRMGVIDTSNDLYVKEGALTAAWSPIFSKVKQFQLEGTRIGALRFDKMFYIKEGTVTSDWYLQSDTALFFQLFEDRVGLVDIDNNLYVKEGGVLTGFMLLRLGVMDFQIAMPKPGMVEPIPPAVGTLQLIAPLGTVSDSHGHPVYEWTNIRNATHYQVYVAPADNILQAKFSGFIPDRAFCDRVRCSVDLTDVKPSAWLTESDTYTIYLRASNGDWVQLSNPYKFTVNEPQPAAVTLKPAMSTDLLTPVLHWTLEGNAIYAAFFQIYVAPVSNLSQSVYYKWVLREQVCGTKQGTSCFLQMPQLTNNTQYNMYIQSWGPGGFSTGGNIPAADGWVEGTFTVKTG